MNQNTFEAFREKKICVVIPTFNNASSVARVIDSVLKYTDQIVVVNDGSTDQTQSILESYSQIKVISYLPNKGKGFAIRTAFKEAFKAGYLYAITIDSDGQHYADDLLKFLEKIDSSPNAIIIGARNMDQHSVPGKSSFGNKFSNFWFWVETGIKRSDTQSGYRLYPLKPLQNISFLTRKYEFEIEVIVRAAWKGVDVVEVPVKVFYPEKEQRVSHFRPFRDFTRISILNTFLVTIALLYIKPRDLFRRLRTGEWRKVLMELIVNPDESDAVKSISIGFGVFMGIVPIWGFQLITAIALSFLFRLNKALVIIAANISIPPMIPLILWLSHVIGGVWMGENATSLSYDDEVTLALIHQNFMQYVYGAVTLAVISGVTFGLLSYLFIKVFKPKPVNS
jgi:glycosyltransferase involved in cell wall biosynthesis